MRIDVHAHITPQNWTDMRSRFTGDWPRIRHDSPGCATLLRGDTPFRAVTDTLWDPARRLADMDRARVDRQLISPPPDMFCYWAEAKGAAEFARMQNDHIAGVVARYLDNFFYDSITHSRPALRYLLDTLGADHVVMGTDYPFAMGVDDPVASLDGEPEAERIMGANAARFLGVKETT